MLVAPGLPRLVYAGAGCSVTPCVVAQSAIRLFRVKLGAVSLLLNFWPLTGHTSLASSHLWIAAASYVWPVPMSNTGSTISCLVMGHKNSAGASGSSSSGVVACTLAARAAQTCTCRQQYYWGLLVEECAVSVHV